MEIAVIEKMKRLATSHLSSAKCSTHGCVFCLLLDIFVKFWYTDGDPRQMENNR